MGQFVKEQADWIVKQRLIGFFMGVVVGAGFVWFLFGYLG